MDPGGIKITIALIAMGNIYTKMYRGDPGEGLNTGRLIGYFRIPNFILFYTLCPCYNFPSIHWYVSLNWKPTF